MNVYWKPLLVRANFWVMLGLRHEKTLSLCQSPRVLIASNGTPCERRCDAPLRRRLCVLNAEGLRPRRTHSLERRARMAAGVGAEILPRGDMYANAGAELEIGHASWKKCKREATGHVAFPGRCGRGISRMRSWNCI